MRLISTEKQKDSFAKFLYDIAKIIFAIVVIGPFAKPESFNIFALVTGSLIAVVLFIIAQLIEKKELK
ncbi:MAG: hypothetical protein FVQ77_13065 [Cytophagales bacterium]|nr:hypothetical protein [Cytophagales bacterium]